MGPNAGPAEDSKDRLPCLEHCPHVCGTKAGLVLWEGGCKASCGKALLTANRPRVLRAQSQWLRADFQRALADVVLVQWETQLCAKHCCAYCALRAAVPHHCWLERSTKLWKNLTEVQQALVVWRFLLPPRGLEGEAEFLSLYGLLGTQKGILKH